MSDASPLEGSLRSSSWLVVVVAVVRRASPVRSSVAVPAVTGSRSAVAPPGAPEAVRVSLRSTARDYNRNVAILQSRDLLAT